MRGNFNRCSAGDKNHLLILRAYYQLTVFATLLHWKSSGILSRGGVSVRMDHCTSQILQYLSLPQNREGVILQNIVTYVKKPKSEVNRILYQLERQGCIKHLSAVPPVWQIASLPSQAPLPPQPPLASTSPLPGSGESGRAEAAAAAATPAHTFEDGVASLDNCSSTPPAGCRQHSSMSGEVETVAHSQPHLLSRGSSCDIGGAAASPLPLSFEDGFDSNTSHTLAAFADVSLADRSGSPSTAASSGSPLGGAACAAQLPRTHSGGSIASSAIYRSADEEVRNCILGVLRKTNESPLKSSQISKTLNITSQVTSRVLYDLRKEGLVTKVGDSPPSWMLNDVTSPKEYIAGRPSGAAVDVPVGVDKTREDYKKKRNDVLPVTALPKLARSTRAVAMICSSVTQGTGFRVGQSYLMTAAHVVREIIGDIDKFGRKLLDKNKLGDTSVYAEFDVGEVQSTPKRFYFEKWFLLDEDLDIALLQFDMDALADPAFPPSVECRKSSMVPENKERVYLIGHEDGKKLQLDIFGHIHQPKFDGPNAAFFEEAKKKQKHLIFYVRTQLQHGSSGAPLFICRSDTFHLVGVHLRSYPSHDVMIEQNKRGNRLRNFQAGLSINCIWLWVVNLSQDLAKEIFENVNSA